MMKYYIVDDNIATVKTLENIIKSRGLGTVLGYSTNPVDAIGEIEEDRPDIVLVDFLMNEMDGVQMISEVQKRVKGISFVMISKVIDKGMIGSAYSAGIEFFISKPVNIVEVENVLGNLNEKLRMKGVLSKLQNIMSDADPNPQAQQTDIPDKTAELNHLLGNLGMLGERGVQDIRLAYEYMERNGVEYGKEVLDHLEKVTGDNAKNIEQRLRRAIKKGLTNAAVIAADDLYSDMLNAYASYVFDFSSIRDEMNRLQGKNPNGGRVKTSRFMNGLIVFGDKK